MGLALRPPPGLAGPQRRRHPLRLPGLHLAFRPETRRRDLDARQHGEPDAPPGVRSGHGPARMTTRAPQPPPLPADLEELLRRMRLPHIRRHAPEVIATARAQRWEPAEVLRVLFAEEIAGRERSSIATRQAAAGFPAGKTFEAWDPKLSS